MDTKLSQYKKLTRRVVEAPSGFKFTVRGLTPAEALSVMGGLPSFAPPNPESPLSEDQQMEANIERGRKSAEVSRNIIVLVVDEVSEDGANDTLPYDALELADTKYLMEVINDVSGLNGLEAAQARRLLHKEG